jgi:hypothetical protein
MAVAMLTSASREKRDTRPRSRSFFFDRLHRAAELFQIELNAALRDVAGSVVQEPLQSRSCSGSTYRVRRSMRFHSRFAERRRTGLSGNRFSVAVAVVRGKYEQRAQIAHCAIRFCGRVGGELAMPCAYHVTRDRNDRLCPPIGELLGHQLDVVARHQRFELGVCSELGTLHQFAVSVLDRDDRYTATR